MMVQSNWNARETPTLALAFIGDAVWELYVRNHLLNQGILRPNTLHQEGARFVRASAQAQIVKMLTDRLEADELDVLRRGRNAKPGHERRSADVLDYRHSTGFETLLGYLYGLGKRERLDELCSLAISMLEERGDGNHGQR